MSTSNPTIAVIEPGAAFSTIDVCNGLIAGLEANGATVRRFPLNINLQMMSVFANWAEREQIVEHKIDAFQVAQRGIVDFCCYYDVDAVIAVHGGNLHPIAPITLRMLANQKKRWFPTALLVTESPYQLEQDVKMASLFDIVFVNERRAVAHFQNPRKYYLPHAYNPAIHEPGAAEADKACDVFFVGTYFDERRALFGGVDWSGINFVQLGFARDGWASEDLLSPEHIADNALVAHYYRSAAISLNHHRTTRDIHTGHIGAGEAESIGPRAYEIAACGGFQLCDDARPEYREVFGEAAATYRAGDSADLARQIHFWLDRPALRAEVAQAQWRAVQPHSWHVRAADVLNRLF